MMEVVLSGLVGTIIGAAISAIGGEDFRRYRDRQSVAGALAGELDSILKSIPELHIGLKGMLSIVREGGQLPFPEFPQSSNPIFDANTAKIGLLKPDLARDVAYVYGQITAFQTSFHSLSKHHQDMPPEWVSAMIERCIGMIDDNLAMAKLLVANLTGEAAAENLTMFKAWGLGAITFAGLGCLFAAIYCAWSVSCFSH
ncbi:conserved hypothetical protein [Pseudomonas sp. IT-196MI5]|uniref:hypothetical protein n=1 Tax=Pseudomonas sp. IT-196MI5 TaxID=3026440 RepID=UPI0039E1D770